MKAPGALGTMPKQINNHSKNGMKRIPIAQRQPGGPAYMPQTGGGFHQRPQMPFMPQTGGGLQAPMPQMGGFTPQAMPQGINPELAQVTQQVQGLMGGGQGFQPQNGMPQGQQMQDMMYRYPQGQAPNFQALQNGLANYRR